MTARYGPALTLLLLVAVVVAGCNPPPQTALSVHFIDVGQGDAVLIDLEETEVLIDGGSKNSGAGSYIRPYVDGTLEVLVITHMHEDHIGGLPEVISGFDIGEVWTGGETATTKIFTELTDAIGNEKCPVHTARRGGTIETGKLKFTILHPQTLAESPNNNSVVLHLRYGEIDFLFMGDAEKEDEETMAGILPDTEVLKLGHHASRSSSSADFLRLTSPEVAVYTAGVGNRYGHPHAETLDALRNIGAVVYGTDTRGTIVITTDGKTYEVKTGK